MKNISKQPTMSQHIERINAWTCYNAYVWVPFFTHMARAFGVIFLEDWVFEWWFSNLRVKFAKQEMMVSIIFITSPILRSTSRPFDCLWFPLPFSCPYSLWEPTFCVGEEGYSYISIITCPCINSFDMLWHCWLFAYVFHSSMFLLFLLFKKLWMFVCFFYYQYLLSFCQKSKNTQKIENPKKFDRHYCVLSQACFALYLCTNGFIHLRA